ncbi:MAG: MscS mechanosensitive ion channel [Alphaproteobacteria bacterium]|nr:MAG: MscS mechanosensitive ion channel [Alphaproteobacteria bacterium]
MRPRVRSSRAYGAPLNHDKDAKAPRARPVFILPALTGTDAPPPRTLIFWAASLLLCFVTIDTPATAQQPAQEQSAPVPQAIEATAETNTDDDIRQRLDRIYDQIEGLSAVEVAVSEGVVTLSGEVRDQEGSQQVEEIALRVRGVVAVQNDTTASVDVGERVSPFFRRANALTQQAIGAAPLILLALVAFALIAAFGWWIASWSRFWRRLSPNPFVGELLAQAIRVTGFIVALIVALNLVGATTFIGTILGGAGVIGLALGFAVRDSLENYISSIMLSLRQPFRANDHVVIDGDEGKVVRLTSRATILMTLDGNHLRIPNATVFKAVILNYTRNPQRRLTFELGVDAQDDPLDAIGVGVQALCDLPFSLDTPLPAGIIVSVGDSNIVLQFSAWIDQDKTDFLKGRSQAIRATKQAIETAGFTLPEPIYRLRIDEMPGATPLPKRSDVKSLDTPARPARSTVAEAASVEPDDYLDDTISAERRQTPEDDLLNPQRPVE